MEKEPKVIDILVKKISIIGEDIEESIKIIGSLRKAHIKGMQEFIKGKDIEIEVKTEDKGNGLYITHILIWNRNFKKDYAYNDNRDTFINADCIYRLTLTEEHGH